MTIALLKRSEVVELVGLGYSTIWRMEKIGNFPARKQLSIGRVAWLRAEVEEWITGRLNAVAA